MFCVAFGLSPSIHAGRSPVLSVDLSLVCLYMHVAPVQPPVLQAFGVVASACIHVFVCMARRAGVFWAWLLCLCVDCTLVASSRTGVWSNTNMRFSAINLALPHLTNLPTLTTSRTSHGVGWNMKYGIRNMEWVYFGFGAATSACGMNWGRRRLILDLFDAYWQCHLRFLRAY